MSKQSDIDLILDRLAGGLCDDPELMLDVRSELASHFEAAMEEYTSQGVPESEALERVIAQFGSVAEVADGLTLANSRRVGRRGVARLVAQRLIVPIAVCIALLAGWNAWERVNHLVSSFEAIKADVPPHPTLPSLDVGIDTEASIDLKDRLGPKQAFMFEGDMSRKDAADQQRAIWEQYPESDVLLGHYVSTLVSGRSLVDGDRLLDELALARQEEPENARYHYLMAASMYRHPTAALSARDQLAQVFSIAQQGHEARYFERYAKDVVDLRLEVLGPVRRIEDMLDRYKLIDLQQTMDGNFLLDLIGASAVYGRMLCEEGRLDEAAVVMSGWQDVLLMYSRDVVMLDDLSVLKQIARQAESTLLPVYDEFGLSREAAALKSQASLIHDLSFENFQPTQDYIARFSSEIESKGTMFSMLLAPMMSKNPYPGILDHGRLAEHMFVRQLGVVLVLAVLLVLMLVGLLTAWRWRSVASRTGMPALLMPRVRQFGLWALVCLAIPLLGTWAYSESQFSSSTFSVLYLAERLVFEIVLFCVALVMIVTTVSDWGIRRRCRELRVVVPDERWSVMPVMLLLGVILGVGAVFVVQSPATLTGEHYIKGMWAVGGVLAAWITIRLGRRLFASRQFGAYHAAAARTLIPLYAVVVMFLGAGLVPVLEALESRHLQHEAPLEETQFGGFVNMETARLLGMRRHLNSELRTIFSEEDKDGSGS